MDALGLLVLTIGPVYSPGHFVYIFCGTFFVMACGTSTAHVLHGMYNQAATYGASVMAGWYLHTWLSRQRALRSAAALRAEDAKRYDEVWDGLQSDAKFFGREAELQTAWHEVQAKASRGTKTQEHSERLSELFDEADELNDLVQVKVFEHCTKHGGTFHRADVKHEKRALQKVFRSYKDKWRRLTDLVRCSAEFEELEQLTACLRGLAEDPDVEILETHAGKMRLRRDYDSSASGGYRDVQLSFRLVSAEAKARGVEKHIAEVQLHLAAMFALKSAGGHKSYVVARNLAGD